MSHRFPASRTLALLGLGVSTLPFATLPVFAADVPNSAPVTTITVEDTQPSLIGQPADAEGITDYRVTRTTAGSKAVMSSSEVPQSISVVPQKLMEDQNVRTMNDVFRNVAGAQLSQSAVQGAQFPILRGFVSRNVLKDGVPDDTFDRTYWLGNVERVEVLKGPASVLYGDGQPGGTINIVSKRPTGTNTVTGSAWGGNYDTQGGGVDLSARLSDDGSALVRIIADKTHKDTFIDDFSTDEHHISILGEKQFGTDTTLSLGTEYRWRDMGNDSGLPAVAIANGYNLPSSRNYNAKGSNRTDVGENISARLTHAFDPDWSISSGLLLNQYNFRQVLTYVSALDPGAMTISRIGEDRSSLTREANSDTFVTGRFSTLGLNHALMVGTQLAWGDAAATAYRSPALATSILNPTSFQWGTVTLATRVHLNTIRESAYAQDVISLTDRLKLMVGLRYDDERRESRERVKALTYHTHDNALSERTGLTYEVIDGITPFVGYSHSFVPQGSTVSLGVQSMSTQKAETAEQVEGGVKLDLAKSLTTTASIYQLKRMNVATTDPLTNITSVVGEQQSSGFELETTWTPLPGWNLMANYAYTDAHVNKDKTYVAGTQLDNVAANTARLWSVYEMQDGPLAGLGFGGGVTYVGDRETDMLHKYAMPAYTLVDLTAYYKFESVKLSLNGSNVLDTRYYVNSNTYTNRPMVNVGEPATVMARIDVSY